MQFTPLQIPDVILISPRKLSDERGWFLEAFRASAFVAEVGPFAFVQDNCSMSTEVGTVRGLHFQLEPRAQGKLVSCVAGALLDVAVDGKYVAEELSAENARQLWVPPGFAHGFCTLAPNTVISYKVTDYYSPENDRGLLWNDPAVGIAWPVDAETVTLSGKDGAQPMLADIGTVFQYK